MPQSIPLVLRGLRIFYRYISPIIPEVGVTLLWRVFRPRRRLLRGEQAQFLAGAELFTFPSDGALTSQTICLQGYRWGQGPSTVLLVHGWEGSPVDFRELVPVLVSRGYTVDMFDLPAHGRSEGSETNLLEIKQALTDYTRHMGQPYALVAHSLAGMAAALLLKDAAAQIAKFVFVASPLSTYATFEVAFNPLRVPSSVRHRFYQRLSRHLRQPLAALAFPPADQLRVHGLLGVYDSDDPHVRFESVQHYIAAYPSIEQHVERGVGHTRLLRYAPVVHRIADFIALAPRTLLP